MLGPFAGKRVCKNVLMVSLLLRMRILSGAGLVYAHIRSPIAIVSGSLNVIISLSKLTSYLCRCVVSGHGNAQRDGEWLGTRSRSCSAYLIVPLFRGHSPAASAVWIHSPQPSWLPRAPPEVM